MSIAQSDTLRLPLKKRVGGGPFNTSFRVTYLDDSVKIKGVPKGVKDFIIKYLTIKYKVPDKYRIDDYQSRVYFLVGFKSDSIAVAVDCNRNADFSDEKLMLFPKIKSSDDSLPSIDIPITFNQFHFNYTIQPYPYPTDFKYVSEIEQKHYLMIKRYEYKTTDQFDKNNSIYVVNSGVNPYVTDLYNINFAVENEKGKFKHYSIHEYFLIQNVRYLFESVNTTLDTLVLLKTDTTIAQEGYAEGLYLKAFLVKDIENRDLFLPLKNKYTLIDFWGTWCVPCRELTPQLKSIHKKFQTTLDIVSIAFDDDIQSVKNYVFKNEMLWYHVQESSKENLHPTIDRFNVNIYPTFILINPSGKIIIRGEGKETLEKIEMALK